jgi:hypothetical protein
MTFEGDTADNFGDEDDVDEGTQITNQMVSTPSRIIGNGEYDNDDTFEQ